MKTVIYLDELLLTNFLAAAMLLLCTGLLCARQCSGLRLLAGSAAAAAFSLGILLPELPGAAAVLCKVLTCGAVVAAAYGVPGPRGFARLCAWYLLLNLLLCGAAVLPGVQSANLCVYFALSPGRLLLCCGAVSALLRAVLFCFGRAGPRSVAAVLELDGAALPVQAQPAPAPKPETPAGFWPALSEKLRAELSAKDRGFFAANGPLHPVLQGENTLIMAADNEFVLGMVKKPAIEQLIREKASALLGRPVAVRFALKNQVSNLGKDPMDALVQFGEQHSDIFTIK